MSENTQADVKDGELKEEIKIQDECEVSCEGDETQAEIKDETPCEEPQVVSGDLKEELKEDLKEELKEPKKIEIVDYLNFFSHLFYPHYNRPAQYNILELWNKYEGNPYNVLAACEPEKVVGITFDFFGRSTKDEVLEEIKKGVCLMEYMSSNFTEQVCNSLFKDAGNLWKIWKSAKSHPGKYIGMIGGGERMVKIVNWLEDCHKRNNIFLPKKQAVANAPPSVAIRNAHRRNLRNAGTGFAQMAHVEAQARPHPVQTQQNTRPIARPVQQATTKQAPKPQQQRPVQQPAQPKRSQPQPKNTSNQMVAGLSVSGRSRGPPRNGVRSLAHITNIFYSV